MKSRIIFFLPGLLLLFLLNFSASATNTAACSRMLNEGWYKTYQFSGYGWANNDAITAEFRRAGSSTGSTNVSSDHSTALLDPKHSTNVTYSYTQGTSSFGECSVLGLRERRKQRDLYIVQNFDQVRKDIAVGRGLHMETLAWLSLCDVDAQHDFNSLLQSHYEDIYTSNSAQPGSAIDQLIGASPEMNQKCFNLSSI
jgi:hypothetical protein